MKEPHMTVTLVGEIQPKEIPSYVGENIAQAMYPGILRAWNDPEFREGFEKWKAEREAG